MSVAISLMKHIAKEIEILENLRFSSKILKFTKIVYFCFFSFILQKYSPFLEIFRINFLKQQQQQHQQQQ